MSKRLFDFEPISQRDGSYADSHESHESDVSGTTLQTDGGTVYWDYIQQSSIPFPNPKWTEECYAVGFQLKAG